MGERTDQDLFAIFDDACDWKGDDAFTPGRRAIYNAGTEDGAARERGRISDALITLQIKMASDLGRSVEARASALYALCEALKVIYPDGAEEPAGSGGEGGRGE